ncbi:hypothetical protein Tco_1496453, partial [Tanacetum coccineum]
YRSVWLLGYTFALQIADVFGSTWFALFSLVTRLLYRLQMCLVSLGSHYYAWLHVCFTDCRCVWLPGYMSALQIADVFGCLVTCLLYRLQMCLVTGLHTSALQIADVFGSSFALVYMHLFGLPRIETLSSTESAL